MLGERIDIWMENAEAKGMAQGLSEGRARGIEQGFSDGISQGISQGELAVIERQLIKRFGSLTAEQLSTLQNKSAEELLEISERLLDADCIEDIM